MDSRFRAQRIRLIYLLSFVFIIPPSSSQSDQFCDSGISGIGYGESGFGFSSSKILIKGGTVVNAHHQEVVDVYVEDDIIADVKPQIKESLDKELGLTVQQVPFFRPCAMQPVPLDKVINHNFEKSGNWLIATDKEEIHSSLGRLKLSQLKLP